MRILSQQLIHLPVFTEQGVRVGVVSDVEVDITTHDIVAYLVQPHSVLPQVIEKFLAGKNTLRVARTQVVSISESRMVVKDAVIPSDIEASVSATESIDGQTTPAL